MLGLTRQTGNGLTVSFVRTPDGQLIAATTGTTSAYFLTDNLNSTVGIVSSTGVKTASYSYDPYGRTRTATGPNAAKFGARYYDPNTGRFTQLDPSGQERNNYLYAGGNPINFQDPNGLSMGDFLAGAGLALGIAGSFFLPGASLAASLIIVGSFEVGVMGAGYQYGCDAEGGC